MKKHKPNKLHNFEVGQTYLDGVHDRNFEVMKINIEGDDIFVKYDGEFQDFYPNCKDGNVLFSLYLREIDINLTLIK